MGAGSYSRIAYDVEAGSRGLYTSTRDELFKSHAINACNTAASLNNNVRQYNTQIRQEMVNVGVRESRDSKEHPFSTPIIIALDVTGSMMDTPYEMIRDQFPKIMDSLIQLGVRDPQIMFMAVGDHVYDRYPIQIGQFESDTAKILDTLQSFVIEGGGGGNRGESYLLSHIVAGYHTETDSWFERHTKGFLFTIGDEPNLDKVEGCYLECVLGYQKGAKTITCQEALDKAKEQYHVFHIHITNASHGSRVAESWKTLLGQNVLTCASGEADKVIVTAIKENYEEPVEGLAPSASVSQEWQDVPSDSNDKFY